MRPETGPGVKSRSDAAIEVSARELEDAARILGYWMNRPLSMADTMSDTERRLWFEELADSDGLVDTRALDGSGGVVDTTGGVKRGGLDRNDGERDDGISEEAALKVQGAAPGCLTTVPPELYDDKELVRGSESALDTGPRGEKCALELSNVTKLGLDGTPIRSTFGLEYPSTESSSCAWFGDDGGSDSTGLMVGVAVGSTTRSSSEYSASDTSVSVV